MALGAACAAGYAAVGLSLAEGALMEKDDLVFQADIPRVVTELTRTAGRHYRTKVHPAFVLLLNPPGRALRVLLGRPRLAAIVLTALAGGVAVAGMRELLLGAGLSPLLASLWALVLATSSAQIFFASIPETFAYSAASLVVLFALHAAGAPRRVLSVAAGVVAFGMVVTNVVAVGLVELARPREGWRRLSGAAATVLAVIAIAAGLAAVQKRLYPDSIPFYSRGSLSEEPAYVQVPAGAAFAGRAAGVAAHLFLFNLAAPEVLVSKADARFPVTTFAPAAPGSLRLAGGVHAVLWLGLLALAGSRMARGTGGRSPLLAPLALWTLFNAALHLVYGEDLFLYTGQWTFAVLALAALAIGPHRRLPIALAALIAAQLVANSAFVADLARIYG
jgi:hypothetical protein